MAQIELENTTTAFREVHLERQKLIQSWEAAVNNMKSRDQDITNSQERFRSLRESMNRAQETIKERQASFETQSNFNKDTEKNIVTSERKVAKMRYFLGFHISERCNRRPRWDFSNSKTMWKFLKTHSANVEKKLTISRV